MRCEYLKAIAWSFMRGASTNRRINQHICMKQHSRGEGMTREMRCEYLKAVQFDLIFFVPWGEKLVFEISSLGSFLRPISDIVPCLVFWKRFILRSIYTWNPTDLYFWRSTFQSKALFNQNKGHQRVLGMCVNDFNSTPPCFHRFLFVLVVSTRRTMAWSGSRPSTMEFSWTEQGQWRERMRCQGQHKKKWRWRQRTGWFVWCVFMMCEMYEA